MDLKNITDKIRTGNIEDRTVTLKELFSAYEGTLGKELFEAVYDLKFHSDMGIKFWAKKVLNKFELRGTKKGAGAEEAPQAESETPGSDAASSPAAGAGEGTAESSAQEAAPPPPTPPPLNVEEMIARMKIAPDEITLDDLKALGEVRTRAIQEVFVEYLQSCSDILKTSFLTKILGLNFPSEEMLMVLGPYLKHEDTRVVANTVEGIASINSQKAFAVLVQMLDHPDNRVQSNVAVAIVKFNKDQAFSVLQKMISLQGKAHMQASACHAIKEIREPRFLALLTDLFSDETTASQALKALEDVGGSEALVVLIDAMIENPDGEIRKAVGDAAKRILLKIGAALNASPPEPSKKMSAWMF